MPAANPPQPTTRSEAIVAKPSNYWRDYRAKRGAIILLLLIFAVLFFKDGYFSWPAENRRIEELRKQRDEAVRSGSEKLRNSVDAELNTLKQHSDTDLLWQKILAFALPPVAIFLIAWSLYHSRGRYRLADNTLSVPGHPPIHLDTIRSIDKTHWDRKGIVYLNYELANGQKGSAKLDDFIYEREPTDEIFKRIEEYTGISEPAEEAASSPPATKP